jgi:hypothetical protein
VARPEGFEHTPPTIVIEGVEELVAGTLVAIRRTIPRSMLPV